MPSIQTNNRAAALLGEIREEDGLTIDRLALITGVSVSDLRACRERKLTLPVAAQVRLARAIAARVPRLVLRARRLEEQAVAAANMEAGATALHMTAPAKWW